MWTNIILRPLFWTINHCASTTFLNTTVQFSRIKMWSLSPEKKNVILALKNCAPHCRLSLTDMFEAMPRKLLGFPMFDWLSVLRLVVHYFHKHRFGNETDRFWKQIQNNSKGKKERMPLSKSPSKAFKPCGPQHLIKHTSKQLFLSVLCGTISATSIFPQMKLQ